jgi:retron-type reverse transcriptase
MKNKGFPDHIVKTVQSLYINKRIKIDKGTSVSSKEIQINQGVKQGSPMSPTLINIFIDEVIRQWQDVLIKGFKIGNAVLNTILFVDIRLFLVNQRPAFNEQFDLKLET